MPKNVAKKKMWNGFEVFECKECKYDSISEVELETHVKKIHTIEVPDTPKAIMLTDRFGNPVKD